MRADPGLVRRFPTVIHLDDYTPTQLASIAAQVAKSRFGLGFGSGLEGALARHVARVHGGEIASHNASLAVSLVEGAITRLAMRAVGAAGKADATLKSLSAPASPAPDASKSYATAGAAGSSADDDAPKHLSVDEASTLIASDFLIAPEDVAEAEAEATASRAATA